MFRRYFYLDIVFENFQYIMSGEKIDICIFCYKYPFLYNY
ncbi:Uncharacterized protein dnl_57870 [Desulfonema limicola]|uniref:Uncharacterized protein n=1 Tax=Desulfonema limicola TaxID=45656 RepID=A0A975GK24_9BACT|nr:Uncharacterized protein dnl_57870 [Desulfonema limicola]